MLIDNTLLTVAAVGLLTGLAVAGLLYGLMIFSNEQEVRINRRFKRYIRHESKARPGGGSAIERQRAALFANLDKQWKDRAFFKSLHGEIQGSGMSITASELVALQLGLGIGLSVAVLLLVKSCGLLLTPRTFELS